MSLIRPVIPDPPAGYHLERAILTTFDLDMDTLWDLIGPNQDVKKFIIFCGNGEFLESSSDPSACDPLKDQIVKIAWPAVQKDLPETVFHAKVWLFEYQSAVCERKWHLIVHSVNIFPYNNLEAVLRFEGTETGETQPGTAPLCEFLSRTLSFLTDEVAEAEEKRRQITKMIHCLETVQFTPCASPASDVLQQAALSSKQQSFYAPSCSLLPFLHEIYDEMLIIAPVIRSDQLCALADQAAPGGRCVVLTNAEMACKLFAESSPNVRWLLPRPQDPFVHAKLFLVRRREMWELYCGSMNLTDYAIDHNTECMVRLEASSSIKSIEDFLAAFTGRGEAEIAKELAQYDPNTPSPLGEGSPVFQQATSIQTRVDYLSHLLQRKKHGDEEAKQVASFLLSAQCAEAFACLVQELPSIPLRKTITVAQKERDVFSLPLQEMLLMGLLNHALHHYDDLFSQNVFLHVLDRRPMAVFTKIRKSAEFSDLFLFRTDVHAFDPSMEADVLSANLHRMFSFDAPLCDFLDRLIYRKAYRLEPDGTVYTDGPAQMTGLPLGGFFENVYLQDFDDLIERKASFYTRCGDDILVGAKTREEVEALAGIAKNTLAEKQLSLSETKTFILQPGEPYVFLGWKISGGKIDFSEDALKKIEESIHKKAKELLIRYKRAGVYSVLRLPSLIKYIDRSIRTTSIYTGFRIVTVPDGLQKIDRMICDAIRTVVTEKTGKGKYRLSYKTIQAYGYRSLVSQYYQWIGQRGSDTRG